MDEEEKDEPMFLVFKRPRTLDKMAHDLESNGMEIEEAKRFLFDEFLKLTGYEASEYEEE